MFPQYNPVQHIDTPILFFTGKGGVGKTSTACATAVSLADQGKKVLLVSTDPASNLQDVFGVELCNQPTKIPGVDHLSASNIDPEESARAYREKTVGPYRGKLPESVVNQMEEQLSGACTVEIAAFDEFSQLLADESMLERFDHVLFDTAPTGHTLRLLSLPDAWNGFLEESKHGASCLGPLSSLKDKKKMYEKAVQSLSDADKTTLFLVARPDETTLKEADRAATELREIGISNQQLLINGVYQKPDSEDPVSLAFFEKQQEALANAPESLQITAKVFLPYVPYSLTDTDSLRRLVGKRPCDDASIREEVSTWDDSDSLEEIIDDFANKNTRVIFTMGKGGVGKTTVASAIAAGLSKRGLPVHLTTTDPAAHLDHMFKNRAVSEHLSINRVHPEIEVEKYKEAVIAAAGELDEEELAYLKEDLDSPCTEEIAVFRAFADVVARAEKEIVVIDTAPTGHTLLLLDSSETYHKEMSRSTGAVPENVKALLPRLRNPEETEVVIVTLAEATPVLESTRLQEDLQRAEIAPRWWVINQSLAAAGTEEKLLQAKAASEIPWINKVKNSLSGNVAVLPWTKCAFQN